MSLALDDCDDGNCDLDAKSDDSEQTQNELHNQAGQRIEVSAES